MVAGTRTLSNPVPRLRTAPVPCLTPASAWAELAPPEDPTPCCAGATTKSPDEYYRRARYPARPLADALCQNTPAAILRLVGARACRVVATTLACHAGRARRCAVAGKPGRRTRALATIGQHQRRAWPHCGQ